MKTKKKNQVTLNKKEEEPKKTPMRLVKKLFKKKQIPSSSANEATESCQEISKITCSEMKNDLPKLKKMKRKQRSHTGSTDKMNSSSEIDLPLLLGKNETINGKSLNKKKKRAVLVTSNNNSVIEIESVATYQNKSSESDKKLNDDEASSSSECLINSIENSIRSLEWLLYPYDVEEFKRNIWEKAPLVVHREASHYENRLITTVDIDSILSKCKVEFGKHLDVTSYVDGVRETHNPMGRAHRAVVWDFYKNGCSVRMLCPQVFHVKTWKLLSSLQEVFQSFTGANIYLTPPNSQGFAPHYDDIEAFVLQIEGQKKWKVYKPRSADEKLPEESSPNLTDEDLDPPVLEVTLRPGDLLYFPRGFIHQASTIGQSEHSLHMTISCAQRHSWKHFLTKTLPSALEELANKDVIFRESLPWDFNTTGGLAYSGHPDSHKFRNHLSELLIRFANYVNVDLMIDTFSKDLIHQSLPPLLTLGEQQRTIHGASDHWDPSRKDVVGQVGFDGDVSVRLVRRSSVRLIEENHVFKLYYNTENSRTYCEVEPNYLELSEGQAQIVNRIIVTYPKFIKISDLGEEVDENIILISDLWEKGILMTEQKLKPLDQ